MNECNNSGCRNITKTLISWISGVQNFESFKCDLLEVNYNGQWINDTYVLYKGERDRVTVANGFLLSLLGTAIVIESAYETLSYSDI